MIRWLKGYLSLNVLVVTVVFGFHTSSQAARSWGIPLIDIDRGYCAYIVEGKILETPSEPQKLEASDKYLKTILENTASGRELKQVLLKLLEPERDYLDLAVVAEKYPEFYKELTGRINFIKATAEPLESYRVNSIKVATIVTMANHLLKIADQSSWFQVWRGKSAIEFAHSSDLSSLGAAFAQMQRRGTFDQELSEIDKIHEMFRLAYSEGPFKRDMISHSVAVQLKGEMVARWPALYDQAHIFYDLFGNADPLNDLIHRTTQYIDSLRAGRAFMQRDPRMAIDDATDLNADLETFLNLRSRARNRLGI